MKILIMGLPGSGKTTLAKALKKQIKAIHFNADELRTIFNDWDFSEQGRIRQAQRMKRMSDILNDQGYHTIADFVCPTDDTRKAFGSGFIIWLDTVEKSKYENTNSIFQKPTKVDVVINKGLSINQQLELIKEKLDVTFC